MAGEHKASRLLTGTKNQNCLSYVGLESTSNALVFSFVELARNRRVLDRVEQEVREKLGFKRVIESDDLGHLEYIGWVFKETLRLWPVIPSINRLISEDLNIQGYYVPKGTEISV